LPNKKPFLVLLDSGITESMLKKASYCFEALLADYVSLEIHTQQSLQLEEYQLIYTKEAPENLGVSTVYLPFIVADWEKAAVTFWENNEVGKPKDLIRQIFAFISDEASWDFQSQSFISEFTDDFTGNFIDAHARFSPKTEAQKKLPEKVVAKFYENFEQLGIINRQKVAVKSGVVLSFDIDNLLVGWKGLAYRFGKGAKPFHISNWEAEKGVFVKSVHKIIDQLEVHQHKAIFFLKAPIISHKFDAKDYLSSSSAVVKELLERIKSHPLIEVGFHSSYQAATDPKLFKQELARLERWINKPIIAHRSHYLRFQLPTVYEAFGGTAIRFDSSIAWSDAPFSKVGLKKIYPLFDFPKEQKTAFKEIPLSFMDSQLCTSVHWSIKEIQNSLEQQITDLRTHGHVISWDFHHLIYDKLLNPKNAPVFEHALTLLSQNSIQTFHTYELL